MTALGITEKENGVFFFVSASFVVTLQWKCRGGLFRFFFIEFLATGF